MRRLFQLLGLLGLVLLCRAKLEEDYYKTLNLDNGAFCFTLLNGTHQFGCSSSKFASHGVIIKISEAADLDELDSCWRRRFTDYKGSYYLYMESSLLIKSAVDKIRASSCIRGLLLYREETTVSRMAPLSDEASCPNGRTGFYRDGCGVSDWNREFAIFPEGMMHLSWDRMQIVFISDRGMRGDIEKCIHLFNEPKENITAVAYPFCATNVENKQFAAGNSEICLRRSRPDAMMIDLRLEGTVNYCDPLSGDNIYTFVPPPAEKKGEKSKKRGYLVLASRMDSYGLIPAVSPADFSVFTSVISLLATQKAMGSSWDLFEAASDRTNRHILFAFLNGESFDYIGSSHLMWMVKNGSFPSYGRKETFSTLLATISPEDLEGVIEPQHIGVGEALNILMDSEDAKMTAAQSLVKSLQTGRSGIKTDVGRMPPSSWHHLKKINKKAVGLVLAPYTQHGYSYGRINSMLDHNDWTEQKERGRVETRIMEAAAAILQAAADYIGLNKSEVKSLKIDEEFVHDLFDCLIVSANYNCSLIHKLQNFSAVDVGYKNTYVGVQAHAVAKVVYPLSQYTIGSKSHTKNVNDEAQCKDIGAKTQIYGFSWLGDYKTGKWYCYRHSVSKSKAISPAFMEEDYDMKCGNYSTYTESVFSDIKMKLFLIENSDFDYYMLSMGLVLALLSFLVVYRCYDTTFIVDEGEPAAEAGEPL